MLRSRSSSLSEVLFLGFQLSLPPLACRGTLNPSQAHPGVYCSCEEDDDFQDEGQDHSGAGDSDWDIKEDDVAQDSGETNHEAAQRAAMEFKRVLEWDIDMAAICARARAKRQAEQRARTSRNKLIFEILLLCTIAACLLVFLAQDPAVLETELQRLETGSVAVRKEALHAIAALTKSSAADPSPEVAEALARGLSDKNYEVRELAVRLLATGQHVKVAERELLAAARIARSRGIPVVADLRPNAENAALVAATDVLITSSNYVSDSGLPDAPHAALGDRPEMELPDDDRCIKALRRHKPVRGIVVKIDADHISVLRTYRKHGFVAGMIDTTAKIEFLRGVLTHDIAADFVVFAIPRLAEFQQIGSTFL